MMNISIALLYHDKFLAADPLSLDMPLLTLRGSSSLSINDGPGRMEENVLVENRNKCYFVADFCFVLSF